MRSRQFSGKSVIDDARDSARGRKKRQREVTMAKLALKWMIIANVIIGFGASGVAQNEK